MATEYGAEPAEKFVAGENTVQAVAGAVYVKSSAAVSALVPHAVATRTLTVPLPAGLVAVHCVVEAQLTLVPAVAPNFRVVAPTMKFEPVIVTTVPPAAGPNIGLIFVTTGGETVSGRTTRVAAARPNEVRRSTQTAKAFARTRLIRVRLDMVRPPRARWEIRFLG
jgi:hypothetical protein